MFVEKLRKSFNIDEPIFAGEILNLFPDYSRAQIFRYIEKAKEQGEIIQFGRGVYYLPRTTFLGTPSMITADDIISKRYLKNKTGIFGVFSGIKLLNNFSVTTQMAAVIEIVTNNETTRCREIEIEGRKFILRKSRCEINSGNYASYTIMQLFSECNLNDLLNEDTKKCIKDYIQSNNISREQLFAMSANFPAIAIKNMIGSDIFDAFT